ncbi:MAG: PAS domain S-box protein [Treponema sp.]|nr:PAS domain S-box protein [Treponema sp.]
MPSYAKRISQKAAKLSNEQLLSLLDDTFEENETLYSILESITSGLLIVDNNFCIIHKNTILESRLEFKHNTEEAKTNLLPVWELIADDEIADYFRRCAENKITNSTDDFTTSTNGGSIRFLTISMTPLMHKNELSGRIIIVRDVTETKNQEIRLHRMENLANLTNLAAGMAHEIKNPLGAISIHIQLIQKALEKARGNNDVLPPKKFVENHIDVVNEEIDHLNKLVMDFLLAVRPLNVNLELKDPAKIIGDLVSFTKPEFSNENVEIEFTKPKKSQRILLDEKLLRDIFINLSQNALFAIKARMNNQNEEPIAKGLFKIDCAYNENKYVIRVIDNGCGMNPETLGKIFEPYYTTKADGTGLGMTMVYKIVKEFSGEIQVESEENKGTMFTLIFPIPQKDKKLLTQNGE